VIYEGKSRFKIEDDLMDIVMNRSTVISALPFLRAGVMDLGSRVRDAPIPVMPLAGPGTQTFFTRER